MNEIEITMEHFAAMTEEDVRDYETDVEKKNVKDNQPEPEPQNMPEQEPEETTEQETESFDWWGN